ARLRLQVVWRPADRRRRQGVCPICLCCARRFAEYPRDFFAEDSNRRGERTGIAARKCFSNEPSLLIATVFERDNSSRDWPLLVLARVCRRKSGGRRPRASRLKRTPARRHGKDSAESNAAAIFP